MRARVLSLRRASLAFVTFLVLGSSALAWADEDNPHWLRAHISFEQFKGLAEKADRFAILKDFKKTERLAEMERRGLLESELTWAREMATCLEGDAGLIDEDNAYPIEFQRHAGRTVRFGGWLDQALEEYEEALVIIDRMYLSREDSPHGWRGVVLNDIADTYVLMGAFEAAEALSWHLFREVLAYEDLESPVELSRIASIAALQGQTAKAVELQEWAIRADQDYMIPLFLRSLREQRPDITGVDATMSWPALVRHPAVRNILEDPGLKLEEVNPFRERFCQLAAAYRAAGRLEVAERALETTALTPWFQHGTYRPNHDLSLERERALLALARGKYDDALARADACLTKHAMTPPERAELHDLASQALEGLGELQKALERLKKAIEIVEQRRVRFREDVHRQMYVAFRAPLYHRACDLAIRRGLPCEETFQSSERAKARAMLDAMHRYDGQQAWQIELGKARDPTSAIPSIGELQSAAWWADDLALIEYTKLPSGIYAWLITKQTAKQFRVLGNLVEVEEQAKRLAQTLQTKPNTNDRWVEPAAWLYDQLLRPMEKDLESIERLVIVWDAQLPQIPFETLICRRNAYDDRFIKHELLIERHAVSYAPSAALLRAFTEQEAPDQWAWDFWGFATSQFESGDQGTASETRSQQPGSAKPQAPPLRNLRQAPSEVRAIARNYFDRSRTRLLIDQDDSKAKFVRAASADKALTVRFLHFATHAIDDSEDQRRAGLYLVSPLAAPKSATSSQATKAPKADKPSASSKARSRSGKTASQSMRQRILTVAPTSSGTYVLPHKANGETDSTLLTLREIAALNLRCKLVTLSGCGTVGKEPILGDWLNGLTRAFLVGGNDQAMCEGVVCTLWEVPDSVALTASTTFYHSLFMSGSDGPVDAATALQRMKCTWLKSPMFGHPARWSAYVYVGRI